MTTLPTETYTKLSALAEACDARLNKGGPNTCRMVRSHAKTLLHVGRVEVGYRQACGTTDTTAHIHREWLKWLKAARKAGLTINEEALRHGNAWATMQGGFWHSSIYMLASHEPTPYEKE